MKLKVILAVLYLSVTFFLPLVAQDDSHRITIEKGIKKGGAETVKADFEMVIGDLNLSCDDIFHLIEASCSFYKEKWNPVFEYEVNDRAGNLHVSNRDAVSDHNYNDEDQSEWNLILNENIPAEISIYLGAGKASIDLEGGSAKKLDYEMKAGECTINLRNSSVPLVNFNAIVGEAQIDLSGKWVNDLNAHITGGVGDLTLILPDNYTINLEISGVLGDVDANGFNRDGKYYSRKVDTQKPVLYIEIHGGIGNVDLQLADY
jgi:hypothetical protein